MKKTRFLFLSMYDFVIQVQVQVHVITGEFLKEFLGFYCNNIVARELTGDCWKDFTINFVYYSQTCMSAYM